MEPKKPEKEHVPREGGLGGTEERGVTNAESEKLAGPGRIDGEDPIRHREEESEKRLKGELTEE